ncbi:MAG: bifunctional histidinol-phosphatase/imidazoleglycerol-phosphate dehydratase HisB [Gammaproteobacteria bacterium]|nr:bifunctional histidinol-phosphatase/imidazoleglycerol-phosphate dehydratase HisB [Gammaproteobacteria bacterium]
MKKRVLFLDRDGTVIHEPDDFQVDALEKVQLLPDVIPSLLQLRDAGFRLVMVTNQDGLGTPSFPQDQFDACQEFLLRLLGSQGIEFDEIFVCPHLPSDHCGCRKPRTGLLTRYLAAHDIDIGRSAVIGDRQADMDLADNIGVQGLRLGGGTGQGWTDVTRTLLAAQRVASCERSTRETRIRVDVNLDCPDPVAISTGIGFFDHMLEQIARHGNFSLQVACSGDLHVDEHHSIEDSAICIGSAMRDALGNKSGIGRYGFLLPMDESEAQVSLDLSGRSTFVFNGEFSREAVGGMPTELVPHFFQSFADALGAALHIKVHGHNAHHMIEACFKAVGRALAAAIAQTKGLTVPSTKGVLA